jgi:hypothetical protein
VLLRSIVCAALTLAVAGCSDHSTTQPSTTPGPSLSAPPFSVHIDSHDSAVAIVGVSQVAFDARGLAGDKIHYDLQFGDGKSASTPQATHVYEAEGTFAAAVTITDGAGVQSSASHAVVVKSLRGTWFYLGFNERTFHAEARRLTITEQTGTTLKGVYASLGAADQPFSGTVSAEREFRVAVADGTQFTGSVPGTAGSDGQSWPLTVAGGSADGATLAFRPVIGEPMGPPPHAELTVRSDVKRVVDRTIAVAGATPITFDASRSTGDSLSYLIGFGDGTFTMTASTVHRSTRCSYYCRDAAQDSLTATLVIADRFGRFDITHQRFEVWGVENADVAYDWWLSGFQNVRAGRYEVRYLRFERQQANEVSGFYTHPEGWRSHFSGTIDERGIRLHLDDGTIDFDGILEYPECCSLWVMKLIARGGSADGQTLEFDERKGY